MTDGCQCCMLHAKYVGRRPEPRLEDGARDNALRVTRAAALHRVRLARAALPVAEQAHLRHTQAAVSESAVRGYVQQRKPATPDRGTAADCRRYP